MAKKIKGLAFVPKHSHYNLVGLSADQVQCLVDALTGHESPSARKILAAIPSRSMWGDPPQEKFEKAIVEAIHACGGFIDDEASQKLDELAVHVANHPQSEGNEKG